MKSGKGADYVYGGYGEDTIWGGDGNDVLVGEADDDIFHGDKGDDIIWGGDKDSTNQGIGDGNDRVDYSAVNQSIFVAFVRDGGVTSLTVSDGEGGIDTLRSIERILGTR